MSATRAVAVQLAEAGRLEIFQKCVQVDPSSFKGPIRLRLAGDETDAASAGGSSAAAKAAPVEAAEDEVTA
jgi:Protein of unknown function (DUF3253)